MFTRIAILPILIVGSVAVAQSPAKFDTSTITASRSTIHPLETIDYTVTIRNSGGSTPSYLRVANAIPTSAMFVSASPEWKFIEADRELSWLGTLAPGASKVLTFSLVTRPESAGLTLANRTAIHFDGAYWAIDHDLEIDSPPATGGIRLGAVRMTTAGLVVFGYLGIGAVLFIVTRFLLRRSASGILNTALTLIFISVGFLLFFVDLGRRDARIRSQYAATQCTVLDSMARYTASQAASSTGSRRSNGNWAPLFALRYATTAGDTVSIGYASVSRLQSGSSNPSADAMAQLPRGATTPCWYDPDDPKQVVLVRGIGGAYGFAVIPLITLIAGLVLLISSQLSARSSQA